MSHNTGNESTDHSSSIHQITEDTISFEDGLLVGSVSSMTFIYKHSKEIIQSLINHPRYHIYQKNFNWLITSRILWLLLSITIELLLSFPFNWLMTSLEHRNSEAFYNACGYYAILGIIAAPILSFDFYLNQLVYVKFRELTSSILLDSYHKNHIYYHLSSMPEIDNPGQRLDVDIDNWTWGVVGFLLIITKQFFTLIGWSLILYHIGATMIFSGFIVAALVVIIGITVFASKLNYIASLISKHSAEFRGGIIRTRDNSETIAFYNASKFELSWSIHRLLLVLKDTKIQAQWRSGVEYLRKITQYTGTVLPILLLAPMFISGNIEFGGVMQSCYAFRQLVMSLTIIVNELYRLSNIQASGQRIIEVIHAIQTIKDTRINPPTINSATCSSRNVIKAHQTKTHRKQIEIRISGLIDTQIPVQRQQFNGIKCTVMKHTHSNSNTDNNNTVLFVKNLSVLIPGSTTLLLQNFNLTMLKNQNVLIVGPSGCGKSSLLRVLSGLWKSGCGEVQHLSSKKLMFVPQKPYLPMLSKKKNTLKNQLLFPTHASHRKTIDLSDEICEEILSAINLEYLSTKLCCNDWNKLLSLGEQQRLGFGRLYIAKPEMAILDESTSALDVQNQRLMYQLLQSLGVTYLSVGHRTNLVEFHDIIIEVVGDGSWRIISQEEYLSKHQTFTSLP